MADSTVTAVEVRPPVPWSKSRWLAVALAGLWPLLEAVRIVLQPVHEVVFGDYALFEMAARKAWHLGQLLGPDAHVEFNHPGPAMFYLLAPAVRLLEPRPGLYLGAVLINGAALVAATGFIARRLGAPAALWTAAVLNMFCLAVNLDTLRQPWNSLLIIAPMMLFVVLVAGAVTGAPGAWLWAAVVGSYELQTHITAALFVVVALVVVALWATLAGLGHGAARRVLRRWWRQPARLSGVAMLALIWAPSTVELFVDRPNNFNNIWRWLHHGHNPGVAVGSAFGTVVNSLALSPINNRASSVLGSLDWWTRPVPFSRTEEIVAWSILGAGAALIGWLVHRRQPFAVALAVASMAAVPVATITVSHAGGDNYAFVTGWLAFVPFGLLLALGVGLLTANAVPGGRRAPSVAGRPVRLPPRFLVALPALVALVCGGLAAVADLGERSVAQANQAVAAGTSFVGDAEAQLKAGDRWVGFVIASPDDWTYVAGVVLDMERLGCRTYVDPRFTFLFGPGRSTPHQVQVVFTFYRVRDRAALRLARGRVVSIAQGTAMTAWRPGGGPG